MTAQHPRRQRPPRSLTDRGHQCPEHVVPATIWACGTEPIDPTTAWPHPIITRAITEFSTPGDRIALLEWPHQAGYGSGRRESEIDAAGVLVEDLDRKVQILYPSTEKRTSTEPVGIADLIITTQTPGHHDLDASAELLWYAATRLRTGGVLVVLTRCDWTRGILVDPTGAIVADAQGADLLYLQHIAAVAIRGDAIPAGTDACPEHRLRRIHHRVHTDVLVFVQPNQRHCLTHP